MKIKYFGIRGISFKVKNNLFSTKSKVVLTATKDTLSIYSFPFREGSPENAVYLNAFSEFSFCEKLYEVFFTRSFKNEDIGRTWQRQADA